MTEFAEILGKLRTRLSPPERVRIEPRSISQAAVTLILRECDAASQFLVIQRAENPRDHWSGHLALPGGRADEGDGSLLATAAREVREEVGIDLSPEVHFIGQLRSISPSSLRLPSILVTPFVAIAPQEFELRLSGEVSAAFWVSISDLKLAGRNTSVTLEVDRTAYRWLAYTSERGPIWGITERIITDFLAHLD
jgi:8-oxo-dGTP pyrophosphatase MutT (NUDIX family)